MKFELKRNCLAQVVALALCGAFVTTAHAAPTVITDGAGTAATIADAGYFSSATALGLSFMGREFVNHGTWASNWSLNANGASVGIADEVTGSNPFSASVLGSGSNVVILGSFKSGWSFLETVSIPTSGHVAVQIQLTNHTGHTANNVQWGVGFDPDQGVPAGLGFGTTNVINATGLGASVTATSLDGWSVTLHNTTSASAFTINPYVGEDCCSPVDPALMLAAAQAPGSYGFGDYSINLAYDLGSIANHNSVTFGYEYIMAVPEPETYAMLLAGLGLVGFSARRRRII
ncbi:MAG: PEPxxWA-CTERM sorting domain-containing protein [Nitrosomonas sp.]|uniref:PEP-CTERM sorting domain-containing protein n=1 Tax=Nitrosomonas sp. TaxID=42353 RepID=UPI00271A0E41|nr:PEP-CTERM sorting domain-containing protein [Nitrosomonas sp.]MDO8893516.1 PEPxxWA-CTERM sorting domain-containing protein [Nitrosomonas sp.]MDO9469560.1 PEPxxWA-CTERM sorting domain-containing protein [Nitrosomonas sp.]